MSGSGSIKRDQKTKKWYFVIDVGKHPITGTRLQKRRRGFQTKAEAIQAMVKIQKELQDGAYCTPSEILYEELVDEWLNNKKSQVRRSTYETYCWALGKHVLPKLGKMKLPNIRPHDLQKFITSMNNDSAIADSTRKKIYTLIKQSFDYAVKNQLIPISPIQHITSPRISRKQMSYWDFDEVRQFLSISNKDRYHIAFVLAISTGMRQSEILGLKWSDIDLNQQIIHVRHQLDRYDRSISEGLKTIAGTRNIHIDEQTINELNAHKKVIAEEKMKLGPAYDDNNLVVCSSIGTPLFARNLLRTFYRITEEAKLRRIRFHDLRHTHATLMVKLGRDVKLIAQRLGHASVRTTLDTYSHVIPSMDKEAADSFGKELYNNKPTDNDDEVKELPTLYFYNRDHSVITSISS